jgi:hypothetical protein
VILDDEHRWHRPYISSLLRGSEPLSGATVKGRAPDALSPVSYLESAFRLTVVEDRKKFRRKRRIYGFF